MSRADGGDGSREALAGLDAFTADAAGAVLGREGIRETRGDLDRERPWRSVSKTLTGMAAAIAVDRGLLDLDAAAGPPGATVRHLLAHASGYFYDSDNVLMAPGRRRHYSNYGIDEAGRRIEAAVGRDLEDFVGETVLDPLGMDRTRWTGSASVGVFSPLSDLICFVQELQRPTLVPPEVLAEFTGVQFPDLVGIMPGFGRQDPNPFGLGFEVRGHKTPHWTGGGNDPATFGHFGMLGTAFWVDPVAQVALVVGTDLTFCDEHRVLLPQISDAVLAEHGRDLPASS